MDWNKHGFSNQSSSLADHHVLRDQKAALDQQVDQKQSDQKQQAINDLAQQIVDTTTSQRSTNRQQTQVVIIDGKASDPDWINGVKQQVIARLQAAGYQIQSEYTDQYDRIKIRFSPQSK